MRICPTRGGTCIFRFTDEVCRLDNRPIEGGIYLIYLMFYLVLMVENGIINKMDFIVMNFFLLLIKPDLKTQCE